MKDCFFSGTHDDPINVHGTHLRVVERLPDQQVKVRFMHKQTFGFLAFNPGDDIEFVHTDSLATYGPNTVKEAKMINPKELLLTLAHPVSAEFRENDAMENVMALFAAWERIDVEPDITYDIDFAPTSDADLNHLKFLRTIGDISREQHIKECKRRDIIMEDFDLEADAELIDEEDGGLGLNVAQPIPEPDFEAS